MSKRNRKRTGTSGAACGYADCGRCGEPIVGRTGGTLYISLDPADTASIQVHYVCIADEVAEGRVERLNSYDFRVAVSA